MPDGILTFGVLWLKYSMIYANTGEPPVFRLGFHVRCTDVSFISLTIGLEGSSGKADLSGMRWKGFTGLFEGSAKVKWSRFKFTWNLEAIADSIKPISLWNPFAV